MAHRSRPQRRHRFRLLRLLVAGLLVAGFAQFVPTSTAHAGEPTIDQDTLRTGWDYNEPGLSGGAPTNPDFGVVWNVQLKGQIYAQPIVVDKTASIPATVVIATEADMVYGLNPATGATRWSVSLGTPWPSATVDCGNITNQIGVTSTPVYDPATGDVYVMAKTTGKTPSGANDPLHPHWRLHALSVKTGKEASGWPVMVSGYPNNDPEHAFDPVTIAQRPGLLLLDGNIYAGFASYCDSGPFDGYVAGFSTTTHSMTSLWTTVAGTANGWGGVWQSGAGLMSDGQGRIFVATGNGNGDAPPTGPGTSPPSGLSESVIRLAINGKDQISAKDFFSPTNNASLNADDLDLGSGGPMGIPGTVDGDRLLVQVGKDGRVFLLNRDNLGGTGQGPGGTDDAVDIAGPFNGVWGHPAYWGGPGNQAAQGLGGYVYDVENQGPLRAFHISTNAAGQPALTPVATSSGTFGYTSGSPIITSTSATAGDAIIWVVYTQDLYGNGGDLRAYDALPANGTLNEVYSYDAGAGVLPFNDEKFTTPASSGNQIFFGTHDGRVMSFGEVAPGGGLSTAAVAAPPTSLGDQAINTTSGPQSVTITAARSTDITAISATGPFAISTSPTLPVGLTTGQTTSVSVRFTPTSTGAASGQLAVTSSDGRVDYLDLSGIGTSTGLSASTSTAAFGTVPTGSTKTVAIDIRNNGINTDQVNAIGGVSLTQSDATNPFSIAGATPAGVTIAPGATLSIPIVYAPKPGAAASNTGSLTVTGNGGGTVASVSLSAATITGLATLSLKPNPLKFHQVEIGTSLTKTFTLRNTGNIPLTFSKAGPPAGDFVTSTPFAEGTTLQPGQAVKQPMTYTPTKPHHAPASYYFNFSDGTGSTHPAQLEIFHGSGIDAIANYYTTLGGAASRLGKPRGAEKSIGVGRERTYQHGQILWSAATGAHALRGPILTHYDIIGGPTGFAGFPTTDVRRASDGRGLDAHFANNTAIYWLAGIGAYEVNGGIRARWDSLGGVNGRLGYPISDEFGTPTGKRRSNFQHGHIVYSPHSGKTKVTFT